MITKHIKAIIAQAAGVEPDVVGLEHPEKEEFGDYSSNIALILKGGRPLAEKIAADIKPDEVIKKAEVAGGGFINIWLQSDVVSKEIERVIKEVEEYGTNDLGRGKTAVIDYSAPNIAKPFGIGHLRSTIIGQALYNLYKTNGWKVIGDNHLGDWGTQFGKLLYMISVKKTEDFDIQLLEEWYIEFHKLVETNPEIEDEGRKWFKKLEDGDKEARDIWQKCIDVSLSEFDRIYEILGVKIDVALGESFYQKMMSGVIEEAKVKGFAHMSDGAWIIDVPGISSPLMLVKSDGTTTYATRDLATLKYRKEKWNPQLIIYEVGAEQNLHFQQLFGAARLLEYVADSTILMHTKHGLYLGVDGKKFSTRQGKTIKLEEVLEEAIERAKKLGCQDGETAKKVGIGAIKYFDLLHNIESNIVFDWEKVMALDGNSGPYLQYTYARTQSVIAKSGRVGEYKSGSGYEFNAEELAVMRYIYRFPEVVAEAAQRYSPNLVCNFLYELAQRFNSFYNQHSILSADNGEAKNFRWGMTMAVGQVLKNGLNLLGIEAPEKM